MARTAHRTRRSFGKVTRKGKGRRWYAEYTGPDGKMHTPGRSFETKTDADGWLASERRLIDLESWAPPKQRSAKEQAAQETVGQWLDRYHDLIEQRPTPPRRSTMQNYRRVTRVRITNPVKDGANDDDVQFLKDVTLAKLTKADVYRWWDGVQRCYPDAHTLNQQAYKRLKAACAAAVDRDMLTTNPVNVKDAGKRVDVKEHYLPTDEEITAIIDNTPARYKALTSLVLHHGLRIGEALAIEVDSVHVRHPAGATMPRVSVEVKHNVQRISDGGGNHMELQPPKTKAGARTVPIMPIDVPIFLAHLEQHVADGPTEVATATGTRALRLLTTTNTGRVMMDTSYRSVLARAVERAVANPRIKPHSGRRWLITRLAEQGAHLKEIGALLGQDDMDTILGVYMLVRAGRTTSLMDKVSDTLGV